MSSAATAADKRSGPADTGRGEATIRAHFAAQLDDHGTYSAAGSGKYPVLIITPPLRLKTTPKIGNLSPIPEEYDS
jgi:hypothetical protein